MWLLISGCLCLFYIKSAHILQCLCMFVLEQPLDIDISFLSSVHCGRILGGTNHYCITLTLLAVTKLCHRKCNIPSKSKTLQRKCFFSCLFVSTADKFIFIIDRTQKKAFTVSFHEKNHDIKKQMCFINHMKAALCWLKKSWARFLCTCSALYLHADRSLHLFRFPTSCNNSLVISCQCCGKLKVISTDLFWGGGIPC